jgi:hypothetical protein
VSAFVRQLSRTGLWLPRRIYLASAALPGAGAYTSGSLANGDPFFEIPDVSISKLTAWCTYTRGAAGGQAAFRALFLDRLFTAGPSEVARDVNIDQTLAVTQPEDNQNFYQQTLYGPIPANVNPITFALVIDLPPGTVAFQLLAAEIGVPATPGTLAFTLTGGS